MFQGFILKIQMSLLAYGMITGLALSGESRSGNQDIGGTAFGEKAYLTLGDYQGYNPLLIKIIEFFKTGVVPVTLMKPLRSLLLWLQPRRVSLKKEFGGIETVMRSHEEAKIVLMPSHALHCTQSSTLQRSANAPMQILTLSPPSAFSFH